MSRKYLDNQNQKFGPVSLPSAECDTCLLTDTMSEAELLSTENTCMSRDQGSEAESLSVPNMCNVNKPKVCR